MTQKRKRGKNHNFTKEQILWIDYNYRRHLGSEVADKFNEKFGTNLTFSTIKHKAVRMGVAGMLPGEYWKVSELAELCGLNRNAILGQIKRGSLKAKRFGKWWGIHQEEAERLMSVYSKKIPWPAYTTVYAAKKMGYASIQNLWLPVKENYIDHVKVGRNTYVRKEHIDFAEAWLKRTGETQFYWKLLRKRFSEK